MIQMIALSLHLAALTDVTGAEVSFKNAALLLVAPTDRHTLREKLEVVRRAHAANANKLQVLVVVVDISDVPALFHGMAEDKIRERARASAKTAKRPLHFVVDKDGNISTALRGPHKGSCLVRTDQRARYLRGVTVDTLVKRAREGRP